MTIEIRRAGRRALLAACLAGALAGGASHLALAADYHEAPILADQVKAGKLPPVAERLPEHPRVITPVEQPGEYGGTWRSGMVGGSDRNWLFRMAGYEPLIAWDRDWTGTLVPNLAREGKRAVISALSIKLLDAGPDGVITPPSGSCPYTCGSGDEAVFLRQGLFTP